MDEILGKIGKFIDQNKILRSPYFFPAIILIFLYLYIVNAWICDDAYITFRTVSNFVGGYGLRWNIADRVQSYTHPLWMLILSAVYFVTHEPYFSTIVVSFFFSAISLYLVYLSADKKISGIILIVALMMSKSWMDYSSSGLENPLSFLLAGLFILQLKKEKHDIFMLSLLSSLSALNRLDSIVIYLPVLAYLIIKERKAGALLKLIAGYLPMIVWEVFSLVYYGFLFPNTAYAKLSNTIPQTELIAQGISYYINSLFTDPATLLITLALVGHFSFYFLRERREPLLFLMSAGVFIYLFYVLYIGGDFMSGRFFALPLYVMIVLIAQTKMEMKQGLTAVIGGFFVVCAIANINSPLYSNINTGTNRATDPAAKAVNPWWYNPFTDNNGICDERKFYYMFNGMLPVVFRGHGETLHPSKAEAEGTNRSQFRLLFKTGIGVYGYYCKRDIHIVDYYALSDAFLARLPNKKKQSPRWRIGHIERDLPEGYFETCRSGKAMMKSAELNELWNKVNLVISQPIRTAGRFSAILGFMLGRWDNLQKADYLSLDKSLLPSSGDLISVAEWYNDLGVHYYNKMQKDSSIAYYRLSISYNPHYTYAMKNAFTLFKFYHDYDSAFVYLLEIYRNGESMPEAKEFFKDWEKPYKESKDYLSAAGVLEKWVLIEPFSAKIFTNLGTYYMLAGSKGAAVSAWKRAISADAGFVHPYVMLWKYYNEAAKPDSAKFYGQKANTLGANLNLK